MNAQRVDADEFAADAAGYLRRAEQAGASFTITRAGEPVAVLAPVRRAVRVEDLPRLVAALPHPRDEEAEAFAAGTLAGQPDAGGEPFRGLRAR